MKLQKNDKDAELQKKEESSDMSAGKKAAVAAGALLLLALTAAVAFALCSFRLQYVTQDILSKQRDMQRTWSDRSLESIRTWRNKLVEQARFISGAEMFRLFAADMDAMGNEGPELVAAPDALDSPDESVRSMAEQRLYMQDILQDFASRRGWIAAQVTTPDGSPLVAPSGGTPPDGEQLAVIRRALTNRGAAFGPLREQDGTLVIDMADPLHEVLGEDDASPVAVLLITVPMEKNLALFLTVNEEQSETLRPSLADGVPQAGSDAKRVFSDKEGLTLEALAAPADTPAGSTVAPPPDLPFARRPALNGKGEVYSLSGRLSLPDWLVVVETPASLVDDQIHAQKVQIYGLGVLGSLGVALLLAVIYVSLISRAHRRTARRFQQLYTVIRHQKLLLDSINSSLQVGLLLVDGNGRAQLSNPEFLRIAHREDEPAGLPLADILPEQAALDLRRGMEAVAADGKADSMEISLAGPDGSRLYRVTLFPFEERQEGERRGDGCVGIFQDITEFRRRAEAARKRQAGVVQGLVRAIESVDANLVGHSDKMARVAELLGARMNLPERERETLRLAARLSQVGRIFVPRHLLTKQGKLTDEERQEVARAPEYAHHVLSSLQFDLPVPETVSQMGERFDGKGSPRGLRGGEILLCARILAVINAFIAMVSARSYREGMSLEEAVTQLSHDPGFDPSVVRALADMPAEEVQRAVNGAEEREDRHD